MAAMTAGLYAGSVFLDIYTEEEKQADPQKRDTGLFFFRGNPGAPFAVCNAGGARQCGLSPSADRTHGPAASLRYHHAIYRIQHGQPSGRGDIRLCRHQRRHRPMAHHAAEAAKPLQPRHSDRVPCLRGASPRLRAGHRDGGRRMDRGCRPLLGGKPVTAIRPGKHSLGHAIRKNGMTVRNPYMEGQDFSPYICMYGKTD